MKSLPYSADTIFLSDAWVEAACFLWECEAEPLLVGNPQAEHIRAIFYRKGKEAYHLPIGAYDGFAFYPSQTDKPYRIQKQWHDLADQFFPELRARGFENWCFSPQIEDIRPFLWQEGMIARPAYTFVMNLRDLPEYSHAVRKQIQKASNQNYQCRADDRFDGLIECIQETEARQKLNILGKEVTSRKLAEMQRKLGSSVFRLYNCYDPQGRVVSSRVVLWDQKGFAQDWLAGTRINELNRGVTQLLIDHILKDLQSAGCSAFDFDGANFRSIQAYKAEFGGELRGYFEIHRQAPPGRLSRVKSVVKKAIRRGVSRGSAR